MTIQVIVSQEIPFLLDIVIKLAPSMMTLILGGFGSYIAYNQYNVSQDKLRLDLFDKRLQAFEKLQEYFIFISKYTFEDKAIFILAEARYKSIFLFGDDIVEYLDKVLDNGLELQNLQNRLQSLPVGEERNQVSREKAEFLKWHYDQIKASSKLYAQYMQFGSYKKGNTCKKS